MRDILRWQYRVKARFKKPVYRIWRLVRKAWSLLLWSFYALIIFSGLLAVAYGVLVEGEKDLGMASFLAPAIVWLNGFLPLEKMLLGIVGGFNQLTGISIGEVAISAILYGFLFIVSLLVLSVAGVALWFLPESIVRQKEVKSKARLEMLRVALRPVPTKRDVAIRFLVVTLMVWLALNLAELWTRRNGLCLLETNSSCDHTYVNDLVWSGVAASVGLFSVWNILERRKARKLAKRKVLRMRKRLNKRTKTIPWVTFWKVVLLLAIILILFW